MKPGLLITLLLLSLSLAAWGAPVPSPGDAPTWPAQPPASRSFSGNPILSLTSDPITSDTDNDYSIYIPLVCHPTAPPPWVDTADREASQAFYLDTYLSCEGIPADWTGNHATCNAGTTSEAFRAAILRRINYFRSMAGIPPVDLDPTYTTKTQAAALMMSANHTLSHDPDPSWTCYTSDGDQAAGSSNLYLGVYGPAAITGYMYDPGDGNYAVGHRRWILYPQTQWMGSGDIPPVSGYSSANALWVFDLDHTWGARPETRQEYVAWPPAGYVPYQVVFPRWSFAYPQADFSQAAVSMTCAGQPLSLQVKTPVNGYGENTLVWEPQASFTTPPAIDTSYQVTITNVLISGQPHNFAYTVTLFDPDP